MKGWQDYKGGWYASNDRARWYQKCGPLSELISTILTFVRSITRVWKRVSGLRWSRDKDTDGNACGASPVAGRTERQGRRCGKAAQGERTSHSLHPALSRGHVETRRVGARRVDWKQFAASCDASRGINKPWVADRQVPSSAEQCRNCHWCRNGRKSPCHSGAAGSALSMLLGIYLYPGTGVVSGNFSNTKWILKNMSYLSGNTLYVSGNTLYASGNTLYVSGNTLYVSGNTLYVSGNKI